ncbi:MAG: hypothetical protein AW08_02957 [Candidatus Accumulibacter adjunctus]|uniref:Uncharacterized protein n=1 Tax=Candidatus Accumulibacter adjunctus TaxID=1454001 RepID=A0A011NMR1_9PROT|nr:MAG: hypothetical protein AW08_02957 [Candidatus Accumulibacter adjunctus]
MVFPGRLQQPVPGSIGERKLAAAITGILREESGRDDKFAQQMTHRNTGSKPNELTKAFSTRQHPRIAVTETRPH